MSGLVEDARRAPTDAFAIIGGLASASGFFSLYGYEFGVEALARIAAEFTSWSDKIWSTIGGLLGLSISASFATVLTLAVIGAGLFARGALQGHRSLLDLRAWEILLFCGAVAFWITDAFRRWHLEFAPGFLGQTIDAASVFLLAGLYSFFPRMLFGALIAAAILLGVDMVASGVENASTGARG